MKRLPKGKSIDGGVGVRVVVVVVVYKCFLPPYSFPSPLLLCCSVSARPPVIIIIAVSEMRSSMCVLPARGARKGGARGKIYRFSRTETATRAYEKWLYCRPLKSFSE